MHLLVTKQRSVSMYYMAENRKNFTLFKRFKRPKTLQTPLPTFPISATTLIIFGFLFINLFYKKYFLFLYLPNSTTKDIKRHSNFSNFRNYPNYFRFPIYKFILQKNIFYFYISRTARRKI